MAGRPQVARRRAGVARGKQIAVALDFAELPFASQSLDLVVLPHVLEFAAEPHQVLREVERVLIPEGQVIICGFNPASLWGARQGWARRRQPLPAAAGEFISMPRMKDWLKLLNLGATAAISAATRRRAAQKKWLNRFAFMEGRAALVAVSRRRLHRASDQAREGHAHDRSGLEQKNGIGAARCRATNK
jgi:SAM-dependent methyltransferase